MIEEISYWAKQRACDLANAEETGVRQVRYEPCHFTSGYSSSLTAFARYIAQHEQPPVDPDLLIARRAVADVMGYETVNLLLPEAVRLAVAVAAIRLAREEGKL